ncbi:Flagellar biosynthesis protein FlhA [Buchnera aphidicola (Eriosoma grossulariae)]|uniref:flagellar biosynthesis protein FlhA n=1 Tax=Buchnera aphidicola TaxID=9 RepID=UPI0034642EE9
MANFVSFFQQLKNFKNSQWQILVGPILILIILSMMVLPLPSFLLDICFTFNIALSIIILLVSIFTRNTLEFTAFPTILLLSTLLRLALNVASTRIILLNGHTGSTSAGYVIEAFGHFLVGGNFAIGTIVFIILVIINFMVITKGAGRIAEVGARFVLDGMPGKQMAIDADLNAGLIGEKEAKIRRQEISQEADFYGSMDGASKFVRGDAMAGILIMVINIFGGLIIAIGQHHMILEQAAKVYTLLTIGDGLVAQIPALVISTASGVIVTRVSTHQNVGEQIISQLFCDFRVIFLSSLVLGVFGLVPGMPNMVFLLFTCLLLFLSWKLYIHYEKLQLSQLSLDHNGSEKNESLIKDASWNDVDLEDVITIELGEKLLPMIDMDIDGDLQKRIRSIRKKFAKEIGFLPPRIHIYHNNGLSSSSYKIFIKGLELGSGEVFYNRFMAIDPGNLNFVLSDEFTRDPTFNLPAYWIDLDLVEDANKKGFTVVKPSIIIATHLNDLIFKYIHELFGRQEAQFLLEHISKKMPKLIEDFIPNVISLTVFHKIIYNLLSENISIRDMRTIIETILEQNVNINNQHQELTSIVRIALGKTITQKFFPKSLSVIKVIGLHIELERILLQILQSSSGCIEPNLSERLLNQTEIAINQQKLLNLSIILLVNHSLRLFLSNFLRQKFPELVVLSHMEIVDNREIKITTVIGSYQSDV